MMGLDPEAVLRGIAWGLLSSVWQVSAIAVAVYVIFGALPRDASGVRYLIAICALPLMLLLPITSGVNASGRHAGSQMRTGAVAGPANSAVPGSSSGAPHVDSDRSGTAAARRERLTGSTEQILTRRHRDALVLLWLLGVAVNLLRLGGGLRQTYRLAHVGTREAPPWLTRAADAVATGLRVKAYVLRVSAVATVPQVIGVLKPVVLLPASLLTGLPPAALRALVAHELAHVRRHDFVINVGQVMVEALLFFHPAAWWVTRMIRVEREYCCDEAAAAVLGDRRLLARALVAAEEMRRHRTPSLAPAATDGSLVSRVQRLLTGVPTVGRSRAAAAAAVPLLVGVLVIPAAALRESQAPGSAPIPSAAVPMADSTAAPLAHAPTGETNRAIAQVRRGPSKWEEIWSGTLADGPSLRITNLRGPVTVERGSSGESVVLAHRTGTRADFDIRSDGGDGIQICAVLFALGECNADGLIWRGSAAALQQTLTELRVVVPADVAVEAAAHEGDVVVRGGAGRVIARTGAGSITVAIRGGDVEAAAGRGAISIAGGHDVVARSGSGDVELHDLTGRAHVRVTTGHVLASFAAGDPTRSINLLTGTGSIIVHLPETMSAHWFARAPQRLLSPRDAATVRRSGGGGSELRAEIGDGGAHVGLTAVRGEVSLLPRR